MASSKRLSSSPLFAHANALISNRAGVGYCRSECCWGIPRCEVTSEERPLLNLQGNSRKPHAQEAWYIVPLLIISSTLLPANPNHYAQTKATVSHPGISSRPTSSASPPLRNVSGPKMAPTRGARPTSNHFATPNCYSPTTSLPEIS